VNGLSTAGAGSRFLVMAASAVVVIAGLRAAQSLIIPFLISVFIAIICGPPLRWLRDHRVPTFAAVALVVLAALGVLAFFGIVVGGSVNNFIEAVPRYQERLDGVVGTVATWAKGRGVDLSATDLSEIIRPGQVMSMLGAGLKGLAAALSNLLLVVLTLVFILVEATGLPVKIKAALDNPDADIERFSRVTREVQHYLVIKTGLSLVTGILVAIWLTVLGVDFALVWGLVAFLLNYIPALGSIIAAVPAVLLGLVQLGPGTALLVGLGYLVVNTVLGNIVEPALMGRRLGISTLVVFVSLIFWGWVWGPVGMLLSVPLTMIIKILLENSDDLRWLGIMLESGTGAAAILERTVDRPETEDEAAEPAPGP
jgi:AI-2 transport protein TqsA